MKTIELWFWRVTDPVSGRRYTTRYRMTEASALHLDPQATRVPGSMELQAAHKTAAARRPRARLDEQQPA